MLLFVCLVLWKSVGILILTAPVSGNLDLNQAGFYLKCKIIACDMFQSETPRYLRNLIKIPANVGDCDFQSWSEQFLCLSGHVVRKVVE